MICYRTVLLGVVRIIPEEFVGLIAPLRVEGGENV